MPKYSNGKIITGVLFVVVAVLFATVLKITNPDRSSIEPYRVASMATLTPESSDIHRTSKGKIDDSLP